MRDFWLLYLIDLGIKPRGFIALQIDDVDRVLIEGQVIVMNPQELFGGREHEMFSAGPCLPFKD